MLGRYAAIGGYLAASLIILVGIASIVAGSVGYFDVRDRIEQEAIVGTPDMTPDAEHPAVAGEKPDCDVADEPIDTGDEAKCFAEWMRLHALEATEGKTYSEMPRFLDAKGNPVEDEKQAAKNPETGKPEENQARQIWVSETALATALNTSFFAESVATFSIAIGIVLVLAGIGFLVLVTYLNRRGTTQP